MLAFKDLSVLPCVEEEMASLFPVFIQLIGTHTLIFMYNQPQSPFFFVCFLAFIGH